MKNTVITWKEIEENEELIKIIKTLKAWSSDFNEIILDPESSPSKILVFSLDNDSYWNRKENKWIFSGKRILSKPDFDFNPEYKKYKKFIERLSRNTTIKLDEINQKIDFGTLNTIEPKPKEISVFDLAYTYEQALVLSILTFKNRNAKYKKIQELMKEIITDNFNINNWIKNEETQEQEEENNDLEENEYDYNEMGY